MRFYQEIILPQKTESDSHVDSSAQDQGAQNKNIVGNLYYSYTEYNPPDSNARRYSSGCPHVTLATIPHAA